jgi:hypothetical protein
MISLALMFLLASSGADAGAPLEQDHHAHVELRGDQAMGFSHETTAHHFLIRKDGGLIIAEALSRDDTKSRDSIRSHMQHIAKAFSAGDFDLPMFIHRVTPPGVDALKRLGPAVHYTVQPLERGAQVRLSASSQEGVEAIHEFLRFQIQDHRTGDSLTADTPAAR